jgi:hypothetical protein
MVIFLIDAAFSHYENMVETQVQSLKRFFTAGIGFSFRNPAQRNIKLSIVRNYSTNDQPAWH